MPPTRVIRPRIDSAIPWASSGSVRRVEPGAAVADEDRDLVLAGLHERRDLVGARVLRGVRHRLACGEDESLDALVERRVAGADERDGHAVQLLDLGGRRVDRRAEARSVRAARVEPRPELALLTARQRRHAARVAGLALDERERLQHRVVDARGHLGALLRADPNRALGVPLRGEPPRPRAEDEHERDRDRARLEDGIAADAAGVPVDEEEHACAREARGRPPCAGCRAPRRSTTPATARATGQTTESAKPVPRSASTPASARAAIPSRRRRCDGGGPSSGARASQAAA